MSEGEPLLSSYNFSFAGGIHNSYLFVTLKQITYEIQFKPTPYLFGENFVIANEIVELVIKVIDNQSIRASPSARRTHCANCSSNHQRFLPEKQLNNYYFHLRHGRSKTRSSLA
jgi:hypothetical protein